MGRTWARSLWMALLSATATGNASSVCPHPQAHQSCPAQRALDGGGFVVVFKHYSGFEFPQLLSIAHARPAATNANRLVVTADIARHWPFGSALPKTKLPVIRLPSSWERPIKSCSAS
jgi:hypothetical protein